VNAYARVSQIILGAAVIDDILGLMVLSVVASMREEV
jgi:Kef-type K+ transport system membrane component KefB